MKGKEQGWRCQEQEEGGDVPSRGESGAENHASRSQVFEAYCERQNAVRKMVGQACRHGASHDRGKRRGTAVEAEPPMEVCQPRYRSVGVHPLKRGDVVEAAVIRRQWLQSPVSDIDRNNTSETDP